MKILNFGSCNIDYVYSLDHIVKIGETQTVSGRETFPGGKGLNQSIAAARVVMQSGAAFVQLPCMGVVDAFAVSKPELEYWLKGKTLYLIILQQTLSRRQTAMHRARFGQE